MPNPLFKAPPRLLLVWDLAEQYGAIQTDSFNDEDTTERDYKFPSPEQQEKFMAEAKRRGLM